MILEREDVRICVLRVGGTNCDAETKRAFEELGVFAEVVHANRLIRERSLMDYDALVLPGGFSYGDYVRAGAIWAKSILAKLGNDLKAFIGEGRLILGICNGFQVLVEAGLLPGFEGMSLYPQAALATNTPPGYNCRWINVKHENGGRCAFTWEIPKGKVLHIPVAHSEGRFILAKAEQDEFLARLYDNDQMVFRYCDEQGAYAESKFPTNPNGSFHDIAGICNPEGNIFGLMPHPERAIYSWQQPDWARRHISRPEFGDGKLIFESMVSCLTEKH